MVGTTDSGPEVAHVAPGQGMGSRAEGLGGITGKREGRGGPGEEPGAAGSSPGVPRDVKNYPRILRKTRSYVGRPRYKGRHVPRGTGKENAPRTMSKVPPWLNR